MVAFTDNEGTSLTYMRPALKATRVKPLPAVGSTVLTWDAVSGADTYQVDHDADGAPWTTTEYSSLTNYTVTSPATDDYFEVRPQDEYGEPGDDGEIWRISPFSLVDVIPASATVTVGSTPSSATSDIVAWYVDSTHDNVVVLPPFGLLPSGDVNTQIQLYRSTNGGSSFTKQIPATTYNTYARAIAGRDNHMVLPFITYYTPNSTYYLRSLYFDTLSSTGFGWAVNGSSSQYMVSGLAAADLVAVGVPTSPTPQTPPGTSNTVAIAYAKVASDAIGFLWSTDYGHNYTVRSEFTIPNAATMTIKALAVGPIDGNTVTVFWRQDGTPTTTTYYQVNYVRSTDGGATWSSVYTLNQTAIGATVTDDKVDTNTVIAAFGNEAHIVEAQVTYNDTGDGYTPGVYLTVTGDYLTSSTTTYMAKFMLDGAATDVRSLEGASSDFGQYLVYRSEPTLYKDHTKLVLAFCYASCQNPNNWWRKTVQAVSPYDSDDLTGPSIAVNNTGDTFITYRQQSGGESLKMLRSGRMIRTQ